jgi:YVTN family beta-propeller protein
MTLYQDRAFIVVNNSHKIVVAERYSLKEITEIEGDFIQNPRYLKVVNGFAYVSNWGNPQDPDDDFIAVVNLSDYSLVTKILVGEGPEKMLVKGNQLYVLLQGGFGFNNKLSIIDCNNNSVISTIEVGDVPTGFVQDNAGAIWILCSGNPDYATDYGQLPETTGHLIKLENDQINTNFTFDASTIHPKNLTVNNNTLYYTINDKVYAFAVSDTSLPATDIPELQHSYYTLKAHQNKLYAADATTNFNNEGELYIYSLNDFSLLEQFKTGLIPGNVIFQN